MINVENSVHTITSRATTDAIQYPVTILVRDRIVIKYQLVWHKDLQNAN